MIYVIDDDYSIRDCLSLLLSSQGHKVTVCCSAQEFLNKYNNENIGCIFLDMNMPEMSGKDLYKVIRMQKIPLPVIFLTADNNLEVAVSLMQEGIFYYLTKPINPDLLITKLGQALECSNIIGEKLNLVSLLTEIEKRALSLMITNTSINDMANLLHRSPFTIEKQRARVLNKLKFNTTNELHMFFSLHKVFL